MKKHHTIGMAGHVDHGKTTLTKALTGTDTDRLKEEKERGLSIEPGFASLELSDENVISIVDVPGHERFIRQMIAGVAGIDLVLLVIAADEGVMPQTKEHMEIIGLLGVEHCIVALTKTDKLDEELLELAEEDAREALLDTVFVNAPLVKVDSVSGKGLNELKSELLQFIEKLPPHSAAGHFRMPIDQVFTVKGHGLIARGTIQNGSVHTEERLIILPSGAEARVRQLQVHHSVQQSAKAGQRAAFNLSGVTKDGIKRGDLLVSESESLPLSETIDVSLKLVKSLSWPVKQREAVRLYIGTRVVNGTLIFFDRNEASGGAGLLCQIRLEEKIAVKRKDRFIIRRPSPSETIGGGAVIDPQGNRYKFGNETIALLERKRNGSPIDRIEEYLLEHQIASKTELDEAVGEPAYEYLEHGIKKGTLVRIGQKYAQPESIATTRDKVRNLLADYHEEKPLDRGMQKAELIAKLTQYVNSDLSAYIVNEMIKEEEAGTESGMIFLTAFKPHPPERIAAEVTALLEKMKSAGLSPAAFTEMAIQAGLSSKDIEAVKHYLLREKIAIKLTNELLILRVTARKALQALQVGTQDSFSPAEAKEILGVSRKYMIPFLEWLDERRLTIREENKRKWI